jgi:hypothetical protein
MCLTNLCLLESKKWALALFLLSQVPHPMGPRRQLMKKGPLFLPPPPENTHGASQDYIPSRDFIATGGPQNFSMLNIYYIKNNSNSLHLKFRKISLY